ncbi:STAS domain-containing protein [Plantactinospora sp. GCM10030261]|uniref:STAS domain-containing protein n=1 Tax=Plantactinospora sp. GCM10030261 TaxID=3273420 RepID=UPI00361E6806
MTVVPDDERMTLICDRCGDTISGTARVLPDAEVVWTLVSEHGWSGSPFATGPHHCPRCSVLPPDPPLARARAQHRNRNRLRHRDRDRGGIGVDRIAGITVVTAAGDVDAESADSLRNALQGAIQAGGHIVVDLTRVHLIDPTGLGLLVRAHRDARDRGAALALAAPSRFVRTVLHTMRLDGVFPIFDSRAEALARISRRRAAFGSSTGTRATGRRTKPVAVSRPRSSTPVDPPRIAP